MVATVVNTAGGMGGTDDKTSASVRPAEVESELDVMGFNRCQAKALKIWIDLALR